MTEPERLCARCSQVLIPGSGDFFVVRIVVVADPSPPDLDDAMSTAEIQRELQELYRQLEGVSAHDARNEVYRALKLHMCAGCFKAWYENPTGSE